FFFASTSVFLSFSAPNKSNKMGEDTKTVEYVPMIIPIEMANAKPLILLPPNNRSRRITIIVVSEVITVLDMVLLMASLINWNHEFLLYLLKFYLIPSNTITVSLIE